ncbi:unnamed protein product [Owenia fusiformis]|uniref:Uncharacterized protein n=1 Tax=Owenia fusiformis TaxID=6347 RepID=A0A8J1TWV3_OWEFU|nr:unnamed protein product [Owenia fusiformis]
MAQCVVWCLLLATLSAYASSDLGTLVEYCQKLDSADGEAYKEMVKEILNKQKDALKKERTLKNALKSGNEGKISKACAELRTIYEAGKEGAEPIEKCCGKKKPNIVLIVADTLGHNDIGYNNEKFYTPFLDSLADSGVKLDKYYVDTVSTAFRASLMTGRHFPNTGAMGAIYPCANHCIPYSETEKNLPTRLRDAGYSTYYLGKWHMGYSREQCLPTNRGFDYFYGSYQGWGDHFTHVRKDCIKRNKAGANDFTIDCCRWGRDYCSLDCARGGKKEGLDLFENTTPDYTKNGTFSTDLVTDKAKAKIEEHNAKYQGDKPLYMNLAYVNPHMPVQAPQEYIDMITKIPDGELGPYKMPRRTVAAMVYALDVAVAKIVQTLKEEGMWDNTVLVFTTDKGGNKLHTNNWPLRGGKFTYFEGAIRGIGFVASPLLQKSCCDDDCKINKQLYHVSDWYATFLRLAGGKIGASGYDSHDIWDSINRCSQSPRREILHSLNPTIPRKGVPMYPVNVTFDTTIRAVLRMGDYKIFTGKFEGNGGFDGWQAPPEFPKFVTTNHTMIPDKNVYLYNIANDPLEKKDLSASMPDKVREMLDRLKALQPKTRREPYPCPDPDCDPTKYDPPVWMPWL